MRFLYSTFYYLACFAIARNRPCSALYPLSIFAIARIRPLAMFAIRSDFLSANKSVLCGIWGWEAVA